MQLKLLEAATSGDAKFIEVVVQTDKALLLEVTIDGNSALHIAAKHGYGEIAIHVSEAQPSLLTKTNKSGDTPLHLASAAGHLGIVKLFIHQHRLLRQHGPHRPSFGGVYEGEDVVRTAAIANRIGNTALHAATSSGHLSVVDLLLSTTPELATMTNRAGVSALYMAAERGLLETATRILESPVVSHEGPRGQTALHAAVLRSYASAGNLNMIKEILVHCPDALEQKNNKGRNFVHVAVEKKNLKVVKYVLNSSPSAKELLNEQDNEGNTPLHLAVLARDQKMIRALLSSGKADSALTNSSGFTPVDLASSKFSTRISLRMYNIMTDLISYGSRFSPQRIDHIRNDLRGRRQDEEIYRYRALANNLAIVAVLIATVTFAAAFTLPGGYKSNAGSDEGMAILSSRAAFKAFLISDTFAMASSITVALILIYSGSLDHDVRLQSLTTAMKLVWVAVGTLSVAFATGVYSVVAPDSEWVAILVILIVCSVPFVAFLVAYSHSSDYLNMELGSPLGQKRVNRDPAKSADLKTLQQGIIRSRSFDHMKFRTPLTSAGA